MFCANSIASVDGLLLTCSKDHTLELIDIRSMAVIKTYKFVLLHLWSFITSHRDELFSLPTLGCRPSFGYAVRFLARGSLVLGPIMNASRLARTQVAFSCLTSKQECSTVVLAGHMGLAGVCNNSPSPPRRSSPVLCTSWSSFGLATSGVDKTVAIWQ
jgi:WD40 repeat protein